MDKLISNFGLDWTKILFYTIDFFLLLFILSKFLFNPINKIIDERRKLSEEIAENAKKSKEDLANLEQRVQQNLKEASIKSQEIIDNAKKSAAQTVENSTHEASLHAQKLLENAKKQIEEDKNQMLSSVKGEILNEAKLIFKHLVEDMPEHSKQKLVNDSIKKA